jgi:chromosome segregation ATPase
VRLGIVVGLIVGALSSPPTTESLNILTLIEGVAALIAIIAAAVSWRRARTVAGAQREEMEASAAQKAVQALDQALGRYVAELEAAKQAIAELQSQLAESNERIAVLESALEHSNGERDRLQKRLDEALKTRAKLELQIDEMTRQVNDLQRRVGGRRRADRPKPDA